MLNRFQGSAPLAALVMAGGQMPPPVPSPIPPTPGAPPQPWPPVSTPGMDPLPPQIIDPVPPVIVDPPLPGEAPVGEPMPRFALRLRAH